MCIRDRAYSLIIKPDAALEKRADDIIDIIAAAQQPDGYLNTYFTIKEPEHRWQNLLAVSYTHLDVYKRQV